MTSSKFRVRPQDINTEANAQAFMFKAMLMGNAFIDLAVVNEVSEDGKKVVVTQLVSGKTGDGDRVANGKIFNVPVWRLQRGSSGVFMDPVAGDIGIILCCDRDISTVKESKEESMPASNRVHDECDAIYLGGCLNNDPVQYVKFSDDGIDIVSPLVVNVDAPTIYMNAANEISLNAPVITLNGAVGQGAGSHAGDASFKNKVTSDVDFSVGNISLLTHKTSGVEKGDDESGAPVPG